MDPFANPDANLARAPEALGGATFGRFQLRRVLGQGGMGIVYLAFDPELQREVALKVLRPELLASAEAHRRFEREARTAARLDHPNLCPAYEVGTLLGQPFLVMPYLAGETLAERLARERTAGTDAAAPERVPELLAILEPIARALHHAHGAGLCHRDVKPGNILVPREGPPMLLDFGLAQEARAAADVQSRPGPSPGTPLYMAPEQVRYGARIDARTDVYGLGVTLFEALTLQAPFGGRTVYELHQQILDQPIPDARAHNRSISRDLAALLQKATAKTPAHRYANCLELALDLHRCRRGEPIHARPLPRWQRLVAWVVRHPAATTLLVVLSAALGVTIHLLYGNSELATELATRATAETAQRRDAEQLQQLVAARIERFQLLATPVQVDAFRREGLLLQAAGNLETDALRAWLDRFDRELRPQLVRVERALVVDGSRDGEPTVTSAVAAATVARLAAVQTRLDALRAAAAVRLQPTAEVPAVAGPRTESREAQLTTVITDTMRHCGPDRALGRFGREAEFLGRTLQAVAQTREEPAAPAFLALHAWALFANGYDRRAEQTLADAVRAASGTLQQELRWEQQQLARAQQASAAELERTAALVEHFAPAMAALRAPLRTDPADQVLWDTLQQARLEFLALTEPGGLHAQIEQQWRWAAALPDLTEHHPGAAVGWAEAAAAIVAADGRTASVRYREVPIALAPQPGLVPIGMNPVTQLWEFYHLRSALDRPDPEAARQLAIPRHRPDGSLELAPDAGIVFVLVPGGSTTIGAQRTDPQGPNYDAQATRTEPLRTGPVAAYLLARHELTQQQWQRLDPSRDEIRAREPNPSSYAAGTLQQGHWITCRHPVETLSWQEATARLAAHGLRLPSEWEWERACRAGSTAAYGPGADVQSLAGGENVLDQTTAPIVNWRGQRAPFDDGYMLHAPVGSFRANAFGMWDMLGNVSEFCREPFDADGELMVVRGGSCSETVLGSRCAFRLGGRPGSKGAAYGVRAALDVR